MNGRICLCCGEPMPEQPSLLSGNPNMCASCSSLVDGMKDLEARPPADPEAKPPASSAEDDRLAA